MCPRMTIGTSDGVMPHKRSAALRRNVASQGTSNYLPQMSQCSVKGDPTRLSMKTGWETTMKRVNNVHG